MKSLTFFLFAFWGLFLSNYPVYACTCVANVAPEKAFEQSSAVFSGKVVEINVNPSGDASFDPVKVRFEVNKSWKGIDKKEVQVFTGSNSASCGYNFKKGKNYLVYAYADENGKLSTGICSRTTRLKKAREDLEFLGKGRDAKESDSSKQNKEKSEKGFIEVDKDVRIFFEKIGSGKQTVIVPLHFIMFEDFKHLAKNRTMIFYDVRNRGRSDRVEDVKKITIQEDVEDIEKIRKHFGLKKFSLIGESYTGLMVVMYAMKYPKYVEKIVQIGVVPLKYGTEYPKELTANDETPVPDKDELAKLDKLREENYHKKNPKDYCEKEWIVIRTMLVGKPANASKVKSPCDMPNEWAENIDRHLASHFVSVQKLDIPKEEVAKVKVPVLTIHGTKDRNTPYGAGKEWSELLPNATLLTVKGAAHLPWIDEPEQVFKAIDNFLSNRSSKTIESP